MPDEGYAGFVVKLAGELDQVRETGGGLEAGGGVLLSPAGRRRPGAAARRPGVRRGIPGSVGGAVTMNAGAYGGEMAQVVTSVTCLTRAGELETVPAADCGFAYRHSAFPTGRG